MKYILVTGGVISGIGKGVVTSSIGALLKACGQKVTAIKIDPYINIDAGTFSPYEHGEVYVLNDGSEVDLDLGNYERFLDINLDKLNNITTGKIYMQVINKERRGDYNGRTVQTIPHLTDAIQQWIERAAKGKIAGVEPDFCMIELGGTIGDMEGMPFVEALRQLRWRVKPDNFFLVHVNLVPCLEPSNELKTKPTQESVVKLRSFGLSPDVIVCRSKIPLDDKARNKISDYSNLDINCVLSLPNLKTIFRVPLELEEQGLIKVISERLKVNLCPCGRLEEWAKISDEAINAKNELIVALVGKYTSLPDSYTSVVKSLEHACYSMKSSVRPKVRFINSEQLENGNTDNQAWTELKTSHCVLIPGGFGIRGTEGKIKAITWARENKVPLLAICLGFQLAVVEYSRNVLGISDAHSGEFKEDLDKEFTPVVIEMPEFNPEQKGGTMRLGLRSTKFVRDDSILKKLYGDVDLIEERHRHRFEINRDYIDQMERAGLKFVGKSQDEIRMEILELDQTTHPYFVGVQYHPEYMTRVFRPSPPYKGLVEAARLYANF